MAFPIPDHLPRKKDAQDISTQILTKISESSAKDLNAQLASSWVRELEESIRATQTRIHERVSRDLPDFERQSATSISVQDRLRALTENVDVLSSGVANQESGLVPTLVRTLSSHAHLAQQAADAQAHHHTLAHLMKCRNEVKQLSALVEEGQLVEAVGACSTLEGTLAAAPRPLAQSEILGDIKRRFSALQNRTQEQLMDAYSRGIVVNSSGLTVCPSVQVRQSSTILPLASVLSSMSASALSNHLTTLRRDITAYCVEFVLKQPVTISRDESKNAAGTDELKLTMFPAPPNEASLAGRLENLTQVMTFLHTHLFPHIPPAERKSFLLSLCAPIRTAVLNRLLIPSLPSSIAQLSQFLDLAKRAVRLEDEVVIGMFGDGAAERDIKAWVDGVGLHYERKRRVEILEKARDLVASPHDDKDTFMVTVKLSLEQKPTVPVQSPFQAEPSPVKAQIPQARAGLSPAKADSDDAWGLDEASDGWEFEDDAPPADPPAESPSADADVVEDAWNLDDGPDLEDSVESDPPAENGETTSSTADDDGTTDDTVWDDPWGEEPEPAPSPAPKPATRLEQFTTKSAPVVPQPAPAAHPSTTQQPKIPPPVKVVPQESVPVEVTEYYVVSSRIKELLRLLDEVLNEGSELPLSGVLAPYMSAGASPGNVILQAAPMALEVFRALFPVVNSSWLTQSPKAPMRFSNDCRYVNQELDRVIAALSGPSVSAKDKLAEGSERIKVLADSWFEDAVGNEERLIDGLLEEARGFIDTMHQERYDECENAINQVLKRIRRVAPQWKSVLTKSRYYDALGAIVETALSRVLSEVLSLEDITEVESQRLSELCRIMNALEGLFVEDPEQPSFVVSYVPSWLKFSYLSEILEASIADLSYLFEEGALVDYEVEELVKIVRALFADTPLRATTIAKLQQGHPKR